MKKLVIISIFCGVLAMLLGSFFAPLAAADPGDINGDGIIDPMSDLVYFINFLFRGGNPPPNPLDADLDGSPGINLGDVLQFIGYCFGSCDFLDYTGTSVRVGSNIRFSSDLILPMDPELGNIKDTTYIKIIENGGPNLMGMVIPLSYANQPNEVEVIFDSVSLAGSIIPPEWSTPTYVDNANNWSMPVASIDKDNKTVLLSFFADDYYDPPIDSGTVGLVATLYFTKVVDGDPLAISTTEIPPSHSFNLISSYCADTLGGVSPSERIFSPKLSLNRNGDANCDGELDLADVLYLINYLYKGGPPPCGL